MNPDEYTNEEFFLDAGHGHQLYVQDWGNKHNKKPIIFLHGGPGSGLSDKYKQRFVPSQQRVIFFDQRGAGKSIPKGSLKHNTTEALVEDINKIVTRLKLNKFIITGGSWGSCLALCYAIKHPSKVSALVLSGIFTSCKSEIEYLDKGGFRIFFPDTWDKFLEATPKSHHSDPSSYHYQRALRGNPDEQKASGYVYESLEGSLLSLDDRFTPDNFDEFDPSSIRIEMHYLENNCFVPENYIFDNAQKITMPVWLVQGRYDVVCPPITAYELNNLLPNSSLIWTVAGHGNDRPNYDVIRTLLLQLTKQ